jgi:phosphatidylglycerol---prolipoprotein diacylglyceryl transferase
MPMCGPYPGIPIVGPFCITFYGIILMVGALAAAFLAEREARRRGLKSEIVWDALIWVLIGGIIGARLWHVFTPPPSMIAQGITPGFYLTHPLDLINTRAGGVGIPGAILGGGIALYLFTRRHKLNFGTWADIAAPALALGQAIGRWANFVNQEVYGRPTNLPWAIYIDENHRLPEYMQYSRYHPLFLYESLWNLANMAFLLWLSRRYADRLKPGDVFLTYLIIYPVGRFWMEFLRLDSSRVAGINANQTVALIVAIVASALLYWRHRRGAQPQVQETTELADTVETKE